MEKEIWKDIEGYVGLYQVSNLGRVRSLDRTIVYKEGKKHFYKGQILKQCRNKKGYLRVPLSTNDMRKTVIVHRLVATAFIPNPLSLPQVNHKDGNKANNSALNLEWVTGSENTQHAVKFGLIKKGGGSHSAKLSNQEVSEIRQLYSTGDYSQSDLAKKYKVVERTIFRIIHNKTYKP